jgi:hypothetical protein
MTTTRDAKTIGVTIRFWNVEPGVIEPGTAWGAGTIYVQANRAHGIKSGDPVPFNRMAELPLKLEEALEAAGVTLLVGSAAAKLYEMPG